MPRHTTVYRREELYQLVWAEPVRAVARRYGVSDVALAKACRKLNVPLPGRGHWARVAAGQAVEPPPLPKLKAGAKTEISVTRWSPEAGEPRPEDEALSPEVLERIERERSPEAKVQVPEALPTPHPLVALSEPLLRKADLTRDGLLKRQRALHVAVSPTSLGRALRILNALLLAFEARGWPCEVTEPQSPTGRWDAAGEPRSRTRVCVAGEWFEVSLFERLGVDPRSRSPRQATAGEGRAGRPTLEPTYPRTFTGRLVLRARSELAGSLAAEVADDARGQLEAHLNHFPRQLHAAADRAKAWRVTQEQTQREAEKHTRRELAEQQRQAEEQQRLQQLRAAVVDWKEANDIRAFVAALRAAPNGGDAAQFNLDWALSVADRMDPLTRLRRGTAPDQQHSP